MARTKPLPVPTSDGSARGLQIDEIIAFPVFFPVKDGVTLGIGRAVKRDAVVVRVLTKGGLVGYGLSATAGVILSGLHTAQAQHARHRVRRRGLKPVVLVELLDLLVKGMHEKGSDTRVRYGHRAIDRVLKQGDAQVQFLRPAID